LNSKIQWIKRKACGYRNRYRNRFHNAIYFHLAELDLYPDALKSTHTNACSTGCPIPAAAGVPGCQANSGRICP
jgi:hypothetical protein